MIDWHHPRIYERFRCFGLCLFTLGVAAHNVDNRPAALAAIVVTMLLLVRLKIELDIKHDEEEDSLERKVHRIQQINTMASVSMFVGTDGSSALIVDQRFSVYLQTMARTGIRARSTLDTQLTLAVLERWYTL